MPDKQLKSFIQKRIREGMLANKRLPCAVTASAIQNRIPVLASQLGAAQRVRSTH